MLDGSDQARTSASRQSFSSPSSLNSLRVSGRSRRLADDSIRSSYDYQRDPATDPDPQLDGDVETVTEPLEMYDSGGASRRRANTSIAPSAQQVIKLVPNQGYSDPQNDCAPSYATGALSFPSILCIPCPCVSDPNAQNCPPTCVTYHPVDPCAARPQPSNMQAVTPHLSQPTALSIPASSMVPQTQVNHIYTYGNGGGNGAQFERDHHMPPSLPSCCGQLQLPQRHPPPPPTCYETQQSCPFNPNNSFSSTSYFHESPQSQCGAGMQGCCPATSNDYRYFAPRRRRRCRREYYLQITKGKCRTGLEADEESSTEDAGKGGGSRAAGGPSTGATRPGTRPTHFPINFRLQKASMNEPITRPALPPTRPALTMGRLMPTVRPAPPAASFSSKSSSSKSSSLNESSRSLSSISTNRSGSSGGSRPVSERSDKPPSLKISAPVTTAPNADKIAVEKPELGKPEPSKPNGSKDRGHIGKANAHVGKKLVFDTQAGKKSASADAERARFGSVPLIQETAASVLRKRHNEIRMQAIREMLEKDMRRLKQA